MSRFKLSPSDDIPTSEAKLLGHENIVKTLKMFLESKDMITPLSIAIHGDWGSGKTSVMKTLDRQLDKEQFTIVYFEPWRYENSDPPLALVQTIIKALNKNSIDQTKLKEIGKQLLYVAANSISHKYLGANVKDIADFIGGNVRDVESFSSTLEQTIKEELGDKKLIIIIDDLDRCAIENTLLILALMKLFLEIKKCICIAAVDFTRLQHAWQVKYQLPNIDDKGKEYLEKIFQIRIALPAPSKNQIREYLQVISKDELDDEYLDLFSHLIPKNPRSIKRMFNLIHFRALFLNSMFSYDCAVMWTLLEQIMTNSKLVGLYDNLKQEGSSLGKLIIDYKNDKNLNLNSFASNLPGSSNIPNLASSMELFLERIVDLTSRSNIDITHLNNNFDSLRELTSEKY